MIALPFRRAVGNPLSRANPVFSSLPPRRAPAPWWLALLVLPALLPVGSAHAASVAIGYYHSCAITVQGAVNCWSSNSAGQLGNAALGTSGESRVPVLVDGLPAAATAVVAGFDFSCARLANGQIWCWGADDQGQRGDGDSDDDSDPTDSASATPRQVLGLPANDPVATLSASANGQFVCAVTGAGAGYCWGDNDDGQLGYGSTDDQPRAVAVTGGYSWKQIAASASHSCGLTLANTLYCWGDDGSGQLGNGNATTNDQSAPVAVAWPSGAGTPQQVAAGDFFACTLSTTGAVYCWGYDGNGAVGDGGNAGNQSTPTAVIGFPQDTAFAMLVAGGGHACARTVDDELYCWGNNEYGQLGDGSLVDRFSTTAVSYATQTALNNFAGLGDYTLALGADHTCARNANGGLRCWGSNRFGQLGNDSPLSRHSAVAVTGLLIGVQRLAAGGYHTCAALKNNAGLYCWGYNSFGQLGDETFNPHVLPTLVSLPVHNGITQLAAGHHHTCATLRNGADSSTTYSTQCWGYDSENQLGDGNTDTDRDPTPGPVSGLTGALGSLAAGGSHTCAITVGAARCWGSDDSGKLGDGDTTHNNGAFNPVDVISNSPLDPFRAIAAGESHTCALLGSDTVRCWGANGAGQLGSGSLVEYPFSNIPVLVNGIDGSSPDKIAIAVATGAYHSCALMKDGRVLCWGSDGAGQLGNGSTTSGNQSSPVTVTGIGMGGLNPPAATVLAAGDGHTCAVVQSTFGSAPYAQTVRCWGDNQFGQLGNDNTASSNVPVTVQGLPAADSVDNPIAQLSLGTYHSCALYENGQAWCWGNNYDGQLGNGEAGYYLSPRPVAALTEPGIFKNGFE